MIGDDFDLMSLPVERHCSIHDKPLWSKIELSKIQVYFWFQVKNLKKFNFSPSDMFMIWTFWSFIFIEIVRKVLFSSLEKVHSNAKTNSPLSDLG